MSSGTVGRTVHDAIYWWNETLDSANYLIVTYRVVSYLSGDDTAVAMAMEQSAATPEIRGYVTPSMVKDVCIRVHSVRRLGTVDSPSSVVPYSLQTKVYDATARPLARAYEISLAVPYRIVLSRPTQLLNVIVGELPRLGFIVEFQVVALESSRLLGPGPAFGRERLMKRFSDGSDAALLCRSMRPALGLSTDTMAKLNRDVLIGGFHGVKDDELAVFATLSEFREHVGQMTRARDQARDATGEQKFYLATLICEPDELEARWQVVHEFAVDGVLVAPHLQGLGVLAMLARRQSMPLLAHNTYGELTSRHPGWSVDDAVYCRWLRHFGADWHVTPCTFGMSEGDAAADRRILAASADPTMPCPAMMPIIQGGRHPHGVPAYLQSVMHAPLMLIVAKWVDSHPLGLAAAAGEFREAVRRQPIGVVAASRAPEACGVADCLAS